MGATAADAMLEEEEEKKELNDEVLAIFLKKGRCRLKLTKQKVSGEAARDSPELRVPAGASALTSPSGFFLRN